jgi:hypothetical protein
LTNGLELHKLQVEMKKDLESAAWGDTNQALLTTRYVLERLQLQDSAGLGEKQ